MGDLKALIEAVERGHQLDDDQILTPETDLWMRQKIGDANRGSMDAALALFKELLPGWFPGVSQNIHHGHWFAWVQDFAAYHHSATGTDPARALLLATLKAVEAQNG